MKMNVSMSLRIGYIQNLEQQTVKKWRIPYNTILYPTNLFDFSYWAPECLKTTTNKTTPRTPNLKKRQIDMSILSMSGSALSQELLRGVPSSILSGDISNVERTVRDQTQSLSSVCGYSRFDLSMVDQLYSGSFRSTEPCSRRAVWMKHITAGKSGTPTHNGEDSWSLSLDTWMRNEITSKLMLS